MNDIPSGPQYSWTCPECARHVPNRLDECRCGFVRSAEMGALGATGATGSDGRSSSWLPWVVLGIVAAAVAGNLIALQVTPVRPAPQNRTAQSPAPGAPLAPTAPIALVAPGVTLEDIVSRSIPAIVSIETREGRGSGFFAAPRTVITNRHVVQENISVTVRLSNGQALSGRVDTSSREYDLAIVRVDSALPTQAVLPMGTANDVRPG